MTGDERPPGLFEQLDDDGEVSIGADRAVPLHWWSLTADEAIEEWPALFAWVEVFRARFPNATRLPDCWWQHNDLVEVLSALRDYERACFAPSAPATAPVDWQRAFRDIEQRLDTWIRRLPCAISGRAHEPVRAPRTHPTGWDEFVIRDAEERRRRQQP